MLPEGNFEALFKAIITMEESLKKIISHETTHAIQITEVRPSALFITRYNIDSIWIQFYDQSFTYKSAGHCVARRYLNTRALQRIRRSHDGLRYILQQKTSACMGCCDEKKDCFGHGCCRDGQCISDSKYFYSLRFLEFHCIVCIYRISKS